ncbi:MAG: hypothetical protein F6K26_11835 [Moorea sp. SIO2I5]|nr:hypothetical protein [Moorena sp. SIO2I5]
MKVELSGTLVIYSSWAVVEWAWWNWHLASVNICWGGPLVGSALVRDGELS